MRGEAKHGLLVSNVITGSIYPRMPGQILCLFFYLKAIILS